MGMVLLAFTSKTARSFVSAMPHGPAVDGAVFGRKEQALFIWGINPTAFGPIVNRSEDPARGFVLYKHESVGRVCILYTISDQTLEGICVIKVESAKCRKSL